LGSGQVFEDEVRILQNGGTYRWHLVRSAPVKDETGRVVRRSGTATDFHDRRRAEIALREADRRKDEFLATLAHELRNPLAPIRAALHLMARPDPSGRAHEEERAMAERQVVHLARLIDDLMDVARISKGRMELHKEVVDLRAVVKQAAQTVQPLIDGRRHGLSISLPDETVPMEADPTRLEQVFWNLLTNAAKYTDPGGRINLTVERNGFEVIARVRDSGIGIEREMLPQLFQMFVQAGGHRTHAQGGLGIGLGLVKCLVEMHGGSISAASDGPGRGSEFVVRLPVLPADPARDEPKRPQVNAETATLPRRRILVVDDNADAARSLGRLLERLHGQDVRIAHDGPSALEIADSFRPEIALLDIGMPGMDGHELARRLRGRPEFENTVLVALSGWGQESDRRKSAEVGFDRHLVKPVDPEALRGLLSLQPRGRE
jgi:signal transduction histidine kinase/CheY-like chemotaxis protein